MDDFIKGEIERQLSLTKYPKCKTHKKIYIEAATMMYMFLEANPQYVNPELGCVLRDIIYPSKMNLKTINEQ